MIIFEVQIISSHPADQTFAGFPIGKVGTNFEEWKKLPLVFSKTAEFKWKLIGFPLPMPIIEENKVKGQVKKGWNFGDKTNPI